MTSGAPTITSDNIVMCLDAHDAKSYPGEPTTNLFPQPSLASASVGTTWSGSNGSWGTSTAKVESVMGPDGKYIKAVSNQHTANGGGTPNIWFFYQYLSGLGTAQRNVSLVAGTSYTCSWWWKATDSRTASSNNIYFTSPNISTGGSNIVTTEWTKAYVYLTVASGYTGSYSVGHYFYSVVDDFKVWYAMLQIEEKTYATPAVRSQLSGFSQQGYNARPASVNLMIHGNVGTGQTFYDSSPSKHTITANGNTTHSAAQSKFNGGSFYFDGNGDYLTIPDSADWDFGSGEFTIDAWIYPTSMTDSSGNSGTIICQDDNSSSKAWNIRLNSNATLLFRYTTDGSNEVDLTSSATGITINNWYHIAVVRSENTCLLYTSDAADE